VKFNEFSLRVLQEHVMTQYEDIMFIANMSKYL